MHTEQVAASDQLTLRSSWRVRKALSGLMSIFLILLVVLSIWVIFVGGAERLENTAAGYFEFGAIAEKGAYIKVAAWALLLGSVYYLFKWGF
mgnify:CR=1 FL=1